MGELGAKWLIETGYFKLYGCCRWAHAAIDAVLDLKAREGILADDVESIEIETFSQALSLNNDLAPPTLEAAQYSVPFCVAAAAIHGAEALLPLEERILADRAVLGFAPRVTLALAPDLDAMFPKGVPARVVARTTRGNFERTVLAPRGEPANPLSDADLHAKFVAIARRQLAPGASAAILDGLAALEAGDIAPLLAVLGRVPALARPAVTV
jgi:2-methylcitrate dehydratase PrpD